ncbi:MAG TPA: peptide chain release factor N(5)-glutamine methyltransferase [Methylophilaceae bacterium]|nr:peptide chain release factor N(5)-glutamine methyltransferase [Methylophilaceae bacterium]
MTPQALLTEARQQLVQTLQLPADEARVDAQTLLRHALGVTRAWLIAHADHALGSEDQARFNSLLQRRLRGEPVAYILGSREFYGLDFSVAPGVLIPRPDTETLVEAALRLILENTLSSHPSSASGREHPMRILDLGTGSGAIAIAIAVNRPTSAVTAVDQSEAAVSIARQNAEKLGATNLRLLQSDWFSALTGERFDFIVSNPPYIASADPHLSQGDLRFEPSSALASGTDGLDDIRQIVATAPAHLERGGWLLLEHGYDQAERVARLLKEAGYTEIGHAPDLAGIQRITWGRRNFKS